MEANLRFYVGPEVIHKELVFPFSVIHTSLNVDSDALLLSSQL